MVKKTVREIWQNGPERLLSVVNAIVVGQGAWVAGSVRGRGGRVAPQYTASLTEGIPDCGVTVSTLLPRITL